MRYQLKRFGLCLLNLWLISIASFFILNFLPGNPVEVQMQALRLEKAEYGMPFVPDEKLRKELESDFDLEGSVLLRYRIWLSQLVAFEFGESRVYRVSVKKLIIEKLPVSLLFGFSAIIWGLLLGLAAGFLMALFRDQAIDLVLSTVNLVLYSVPPLVLALLLRMLVVSENSWFELGSPLELFTSSVGFSESLVQIFSHFALPSFCFGFSHFVFTSFLFRQTLLSEEKKLYFCVAQSKGFSRGMVLLKHATVSALVPVATNFGSYLALFVSGSLLIEQVFNLDGVGLLTYRSILNHDYAVAIAIILSVSVLYVLGRFLSDLCIQLLDPRIEFDECH